LNASKGEHLESLGSQRMASIAAKAIEAYGSAATSTIPSFLRLASNENATVRELAIRMLGNFININRDARSQVQLALSDADQAVRAAAAKVAVASEEVQKMAGGSLQHANLGAAIDKEFSPCLSEIRRIRTPPTSDRIEYTVNNAASVSAAEPPLPPLPWPPPRWSHIGVFGRDFPRELLGSVDAKLGEVQDRLFRALQRVDPGFESGLFSVPDGFAMLAKLERINHDGTPLPQGRRWVYGEIPPLSLSDYLSHLFFEKPGYFRVVAFVVTSEQNFGSSDKPLPVISSGGTLLPSAVKQLPFKGRECFVLVYSFERRPGGLIKKYDTLSAKIHLERSGILTSIGSPP